MKNDAIPLLTIFQTKYLDTDGTNWHPTASKIYRQMSVMIRSSAPAFSGSSVVVMFSRSAALDTAMIGIWMGNIIEKTFCQMKWNWESQLLQIRIF